MRKTHEELDVKGSVIMPVMERSSSKSQTVPVLVTIDREHRSRWNEVEQALIQRGFEVEEAIPLARTFVGRIASEGKQHLCEVDGVVTVVDEPTFRGY